MTNIRVLSESQVINIFNECWLEGLDVIKESFLEREKRNVILPSKTSQVFDEETQNRINCMPSALIEKNVSGLKWVSVFPSNKLKGIENVNGITLISEIETGKPVAIIGSTWLTKYRTAGVAALASKYLAREENSIISFIGAGQEARMHFELFKLVHPEIVECRISSRTHNTCQSFYDELKNKYSDVKFVICDNDFERAVRGSDIVVTAISGQEPVLKGDWLDKANLYIHVGGFEDEFAVAKRASKIVCDEWDAVKHRGSQTISKMYACGELADEDIYAELGEILSNKKSGREDNDGLIYFNSVGMAYVDVILAKYIYDKACKANIGSVISI